LAAADRAKSTRPCRTTPAACRCRRSADYWPVSPFASAAAMRKSKPAGRGLASQKSRLPQERRLDRPSLARHRFDVNNFLPLLLRVGRRCAA